MRAAVVLALSLAACTPDIVSGAYLCGPNGACPEDQLCNGPDNTCVLAGTAKPFECHPEVQSEPDDTAAQARELTALTACVSPSTATANCMLTGDSADWVRFTAPAVCTAVQVEASVIFPIAFEQVGLELWDLDHDMKIGSDVECSVAGDAGNEQRCLKVVLTPGGNYGIAVKPTGEGNCDGQCPYNRYTLRVQLATPG